ncbi:MAG: hypothetical protein AAFR87_05035 [Bacteroidota bacterium]
MIKIIRKLLLLEITAPLSLKLCILVDAQASRDVLVESDKGMKVFRLTFMDVVSLDDFFGVQNLRKE